jgi:exosortase/archaeosortase family protein
MACSIFTAITLDANRVNKLAYVAVAAQISVLTNTLRIVLIGVIGNGGGAATAARLHDASGIFSVLICLGILALVGKLIGCGRYLPPYAPVWSQKEKQS